MYQALGNRLVVKKLKERITASGILLSEQEDSAVFEFEVIATSADHQRFLGKTVIAERRHVIEFDSDSEGCKIGALKVDDILTVKQ